MAMGLPQMVYADGIKKTTQVKFGGYDHNIGAGDGSIWEMKNMSSDLAPLLSPRGIRYQVGSVTAPNGIYFDEVLCLVDGTSFLVDGTEVGTVADSRKTFASIGHFIIILPDQKYYNKYDGTFGTLEEDYYSSTGDATFCDGTYAGADAVANTIYVERGEPFPFHVGDAITISGCTVHPENNKTAIIREIDGQNRFLRFYENAFVLGEGETTYTEPGVVRIRRTVPVMEFLCENENRLWGCKGRTIYASKLGDPFNWNVFDGLETDSYAVEVGSYGAFTGCTSYLGYPIFFKEENVYKVYGSRPSNFQVMGSATVGVQMHCGQSIAAAGEKLFYLSKNGIVAYAGGIPQSIAAPFGMERYSDAVAGSDGMKYYVSMQEGNKDGKVLFVFDTQKGLWHKEDNLSVVGFAWNGELHALDADGKLWLIGNPKTIPRDATPEAPVTAEVIFGRFNESEPNKKGIAKLQIRMELAEGATVEVWIQFDSDGVWRKIKSLSADTLKSYYLPIVPRRCDHYQLKLSGVGGWKIMSMSRAYSTGSER